MTEFFLTVVNMSISASWLILAIILLRLLLKKAPKWMTVLLWGIVAVRLICPFSIESALSLIPSAETIQPEFALHPAEIDSGVTFIDNTINPIISDATISFQPEKDLNFFQFIMPYLAVIWLVGIAVLLLYTAISYGRLRKKIGTAVLLQDNIFQSENVISPFVLGIFKPRIFLPFHLNAQDMSHVIAHEQAHIQRKDHWWKPFGFLLLSIHWFNPLMWLGYILLCRDIELACDEKVIKKLNASQKADYSQALLTCSVNRRTIAACPLAFGEVSVKNRVKSVLNYKKPAFWIVVVAIVASLVVAVCFLTNPKTEITSEMSACIEGFILTHHRNLYKTGEFSCTDFQVLGAKKDGDCTTVYMWVLYQEYTDDDGQIQEVSGGHIPTVITLRKYSGSYVLEEYWEPRDGSYYAKDIREKFPWYLYGKAIDSQLYIKLQQENCYQKACDYFSSVSDFGGADGPADVTVSTNMEQLKNQFPMYFHLPTGNGLEVYIWQMSPYSYFCGLLPCKTPGYTQEELWNLHKYPAYLEQMRAIVNDYIASGKISQQDIDIIPIQMPHSSYGYLVDDDYCRQLRDLFWSGEPAPIDPEWTLPFPAETFYWDPAITESIPEPIEEETVPPQNNSEESNNSQYKLIASGMDITQDHYLSVTNITDNSCDIHLPFTAIAQCYGVTVNRKSDTVTELTYQGTKYILNLSDVSLVKEGENVNCILPAPGSTVQAQVMGDELILDDVTLRTTFSFMGIQVQIRISHQDKTVTIQKI